tara:strand:- start:192 stop:1118 length:927 start_codon:yes stop_codon:yes gene_type:complete
MNRRMSASAGGSNALASAGADQAQAGLVLVTLDGSGSTAGTYAWTLLDPLGVSRTALFNNAAVQSPTFTPDLGGIWLATLTVDSADTDTVGITVGDSVFGITFNPITATKVDANSVENAIPVAVAGGFYTIAFDADTAATAPADALIYHIALPVGFDDTFLLTAYLEMKNETDTRLCASVALVDAPAGMGSANGCYGGISQETSGNYDHFVRQISVSMPNTGASAGNPPMYMIQFQHNTNRTTAQGTLSDQSTSPWTWMANDTDQQDTSEATSGAASLALMITTRTNKSDTETLQVKVRYKLELLDAA